VKPNIDGVWEPNEWNNANELQLTQTATSGGVTCKGGVYLRLTHDNSSLFGLVDVVVDDGSEWTVGNKTYVGSISFLFDGNNDGGFQSDDKGDYVVGFSPGHTGAALWSKSFSNFSSRVLAGISLGPSPHSQIRHRIYEFSIPVQPLIKYAQLQNGEPVIGFELIVAYASYGLCELVGSSGAPARLVFGPIVVAENVDLIMPLLFVLLVMLPGKRRFSIITGSKRSAGR